VPRRRVERACGVVLLFAAAGFGGWHSNSLLASRHSDARPLIEGYNSDLAPAVAGLKSVISSFPFHVEVPTDAGLSFARMSWAVQTDTEGRRVYRIDQW
jgi:hypothetical protein